MLSLGTTETNYSRRIITQFHHDLRSAGYCFQKKLLNILNIQNIQPFIRKQKKQKNMVWIGVTFGVNMQ